MGYCIEMRHIDIFSFEFIKLLIHSLKENGNLDKVLTIGVFLVFFLVTIFLKEIKRKIKMIKHIQEEMHLKETECINCCYKLQDLKKEEREELIKTGLLLTLPVSIGFFIPLIMLLFFLLDIFTCTSISDKFGDFLYNIIGILVMIIGIYIYSNIISHWYLHQLITNQCKISIESVTSITTDFDKTTRIKKRYGYGYFNPVIQFVSTESYVNIPTLYRSIDENIVVGAKVYVIHMKNGKKYILSKK